MPEGYVKKENLINQISGVYIKESNHGNPVNRIIGWIYKGTQLIWQLAQDVINCCFSTGKWINDAPWIDDETWKNN